MEEIECDDFDFDIDQDISNDVPLVESRGTEKKLTNNNYLTNDVVVLSDSDDECITINDEEETSKNSDVRFVTINNIVVHCVSINSCTNSIDVDQKQSKTIERLHSPNIQNKRQKRNKQGKCVTLNDENDCVIVNDSDNRNRKIQKRKNNVELVSFNNIGKLVTLEDDKYTKCVTSDDSENIQLNIVTLNDSKNLISLVDNEVCVNSKNDNFDSMDNNQQLIQSNDGGNATEEVFEVTLNDNFEEGSVVRVEEINITIERCIDNEVEKCILNEQSKEECIKDEDSFQKYTNSDDQSNEECMVIKEKDNSDENGLNKGCSINLYDSEFTIEEGFDKNINNSFGSSNNNDLSDQLFECELCAFKSPNINGLLDHLESHPLSKHLSCSMCKYKCKYKYTLEAHVMREHTKVKPLNCPFCRYKCLEKIWLKKHMENHKEIFECGRCKKVFLSKTTLYTHRDKCNICV